MSNTEMKEKFDYALLLTILDNTFGNVFVTDHKGKVIFVNDRTAKAFGMPRQEIIHKTAKELIQMGVISKSTSLEAIEKKGTAIGRVTTQTGDLLANFSKPLLDENGEIRMIMTFGQQQDIMNEFFDAIENEKKKSQAYKEVISRIGGLKGQNTELIVASDTMKNLIRKIDKVAATESTIMLYGESGVGKDVLANYIHKKSLRESEPFVPVNCAAIPLELMESEFFGYEKGAFTGAQAKGKVGIFELADKGTLFLDEIGELPLAIQAKFLRVIETGIIMRVGGNKPIKTDVRLIVATNRNLQHMINEKLFREDLYFRLNVIAYTIPPLRERREEILIFAQYFLDIFNRKYAQKKAFSQEAQDELKKYEWKGNIRELKNIIERLVLTSDDDTLNVSNVLDLGAAEAPAPNNAKETASAMYSNAERKKVVDVLLSVNGNKTQAAKILGISKGKLYALLEK